MHNAHIHTHTHANTPLTHAVEVVYEGNDYRQAPGIHQPRSGKKKLNNNSEYMVYESMSTNMGAIEQEKERTENTNARSNMENKQQKGSQ